MNKKKYRVAVIGATGMVGGGLLKILESSNFELEIYLIASKKSVGKHIEFRGKSLKIESLDKLNFENIDVVFGCAGSDISKLFIDKIKSGKCLLIDEASFLRTDPEIILMVPEINYHKLQSYQNKTIVASPNCCAVPLALVLNRIMRVCKIKRVSISTYQSCSGVGINGVKELYNYTNEYIKKCNGDELNFSSAQKLSRYIPRDISFNIVPQVGSIINSKIDSNKTDDKTDDKKIKEKIRSENNKFHNYTEEETKIIFEINKILNQEIQISITSVRVPVFVGHSFSCNIELENELSTDSILSTFDLDEHSKSSDLDEHSKSLGNDNYFSNAFEIESEIESKRCVTSYSKVIYSDEYKTPREVMGKDDIFVSRLRKSYFSSKVFDLWITSDNLRKGASLNLFHIFQSIFSIH